MHRNDHPKVFKPDKVVFLVCFLMTVLVSVCGQDVNKESQAVLWVGLIGAIYTDCENRMEEGEKSLF